MHLKIGMEALEPLMNEKIDDTLCSYNYHIPVSSVIFSSLNK